METPCPHGGVSFNALLAPDIAAAYTASLSMSMDVQHIAHLARLHLTEEERAQFQGQLEQILSYVESLSRLNVDGVEPTAHAIPVENVLRPDEVRPCLPRDDVLANAPEQHQDQFVVPKIIE
jgi:aspartyl-tRNA(Asn)/glutamyl-tRNA(Gln) amidotransferase subunit C